MGAYNPVPLFWSLPIMKTALNLVIDISTSESIPSKVYDNDGMGDTVIGKVHRLPLSYRLDRHHGTIPCFMQSFATYSQSSVRCYPDKFNEVENTWAGTWGTITATVKMFEGSAVVKIDGYPIRIQADQMKDAKYKSFKTRGAVQLPLNMVASTLNVPVLMPVLQIDNDDHSPLEYIDNFDDLRIAAGG